MRSLAWLLLYPALAHADPSWRWDNPRPQGNDLLAVFGVGKEVIAVGDAGAIVRSTDGGVEWSSAPSGTTRTLEGIGGSGRDDLYAVGAMGTILRSSDGGASWKGLSPGTIVGLHAVWASARHDVYVVGDDGAILHSTDDGVTWSALHGARGESLRAVWGSWAGDVYAVGAHGYVVQSSDRGKRWSTRFAPPTPPAAAELSSLVGTGPDRIVLGGGVVPYAAGDPRVYAMVFISLDGGGAWQSATVGALTTANRAHVRGLAVDARKVMYAVGDAGLLTRSLDGGTSWLPLASGVTQALAGVWAGPGGVVAVGDQGAILHSVDGVRWRPRTRGLSSFALAAIFGVSHDDLYATGSGCRVLRTRDGGATWTQQAACATGETLSGVWGSGANDVYAVGDGGVILHTSDGGASWRAQPSGSRDDLRAVWGAWRDRVFAVGARGTILLSSDGGASWQRLPSGTTEDLGAVWGASKEDLFVVGARGTLRASSDGGRSWRALKLGVKTTLTAIWGASAAELYVASASGAILHSSDGGNRWVALTTVAAEVHALGGEAHPDGSPTELFVVGRTLGARDGRGVVLRSVDGGHHFAEEPIASRAGLDALWWSQGELRAVGEAGAILHRSK